MSHISFCGASPLLAKHCFPFSKGSNVFMWYAVFCLWKIEEAPQGVVFLFCWTWCHFKRRLQPPDVVSTTERSMNKLRLRLWKLNVGCWHHKTPECACCERWLAESRQKWHSDWRRDRIRECLFAGSSALTLYCIHITRSVTEGGTRSLHGCCLSFTSPVFLPHRKLEIHITWAQTHTFSSFFLFTAFLLKALQPFT